MVVACGLAVGVGVAISPAWATNALWEQSTSEGDAAKLFRESVIIILSSPYSIGTLVSVVLNLVIPRDADEVPARDEGTIPSHGSQRDV